MAQIVSKFGGVSVGDIVTFKGGGPNFLVAGFQAPEPAAPIDPMTPGAAFVEASPVARLMWFNTITGAVMTTTIPVSALTVKTPVEPVAPPAPRP